MYLPISDPSPAAPPALHFSPTHVLLADDDADDSNGRLGNWSSLIGITTAIVGNVLIALALNVQRYAHIRLHQERKRVRERARQALKNAAKNGAPPPRSYGSLDGSPGDDGRVEARRDDDDDNRDDEYEVDETVPLAQSFRSEESRWSEGLEEDEDDDDDDDDMPKAPSTYLKSPYWWLGQILITVGEMGNFLAYGFAPASIVSPLGVVALISNCVIAPLFFKERFRTRDFWGVIIAVGGAVTVVFSANTQETKLDPHAVWEHITSTGFEIYMGVTIGLIFLLVWLSPKYGNRTILIDLGLVGLFGGYTALSTKGVSSMLSSTLLRAFTTPVTYVLIAILLGTAILQVRYVNKALQRFDSTQVIPIQFVSFTLCVIIGSAVLYRDFERTNVEQAAKFVGGCLLTFFGVFLITSGRPPADEDEDEDMLSDEEGVEENINLAAQEANASQTTTTPQQPQQQQQQQQTPTGRRDSETRTSRRSSRVSFMDAVNKPLAVLAETGTPTSRSPGGSTGPRPPLHSADTHDSAPTPLLRTPSRERAAHHPGMMPHGLPSSDSAVTISSATPLIHSEPATHPGTPLNPFPPSLGDDDDATPAPAPRTSVPRPRSHRLSGPLFSPSPLDSTVRGLVPSTLLLQQQEARPLSRRWQHSRPTIRSSLYVSQEDLLDDEDDDDEEDEGEGIMSAIERSRTADHHPFGGGDACDDNDRRESGLRNRAKSLTYAVGDLFGMKNNNTATTSSSSSSRKKKKKKKKKRGDVEDGAGLAGAVLVSPRRTNISTTTL